MNILHYLLGKTLAEHEGASSRVQETAGVLTATLGIGPMPLVALMTIAREDAESQRRAVAGVPGQPRLESTGTRAKAPG